MNEPAIREAVKAYRRMLKWSRSSGKRTGEKGAYKGETADAVQERHGIRYEDDPRLWQIYADVVIGRAA